MTGRKDRRVAFVITQGEYDELEGEAYDRFMTLSEFVRFAIRQEIKREKKG